MITEHLRLFVARIENVRLRLALALEKRRHNQMREGRARDYDKWSRYAKREGNEFWREHFALLARRERENKIR